MPFVAAPRQAQIEWRAIRNGQGIENRIFVDCGATPTPAQLEALAIAAWNWWETVHAEHLSTEVLLSSVVATDWTEQNGDQFTYAPDATTTGDLSGGALPNEVSMCISLRTGVRGRSARGRFYTMSVSNSQMQDTNHITAFAGDELLGDMAGLKLAMTGAGGTWNIVSFITNNAPRPGGPVYFPVTTFTLVDLTVDSMKRRKPGVGT